MRNEDKKLCIYGAVIFVLTIVFLYSTGYVTDASTLLVLPLSGLVMGCIPFGWHVLNKITPRIFLFMPIIGWVLYFGVKAMLSAIIGIFACPIVLIRMSNSRLNESNSLQSIENRVVENAKLYGTGYILMNGKWKCADCGLVHQKEDTVCTCGYTKSELLRSLLQE